MYNVFIALGIVNFVFLFKYFKKFISILNHRLNPDEYILHHSNYNSDESLSDYLNTSNNDNDSEDSVADNDNVASDDSANSVADNDSADSDDSADNDSADDDSVSTASDDECEDNHNNCMCCEEINDIVEHNKLINCIREELDGLYYDDKLE